MPFFQRATMGNMQINLVRACKALISPRVTLDAVNAVQPKSLASFGLIIALIFSQLEM